MPSWKADWNPPVAAAARRVLPGGIRAASPSHYPIGRSVFFFSTFLPRVSLSCARARVCIVQGRNAAAAESFFVLSC